MVGLKVTDHQKEWAEWYVDNNNMANRGTYDGGKFEQFVGKLGEKVVADALGIALDPRSGNDYGEDLVINGLIVDVKTKPRDYKMEAWYCWNVPVSQYERSYKTQAFLFCSYNRKSGWVNICGMIPKEDFKVRSIYLPKGAYRVKSNGDKYPVIKGVVGYPCECMESPQAAMFEPRSIEDIKFKAQHWATCI